MIVAISRFRTSVAEGREIASRFRGRSRRVDAYDGFLGLEVLVSRGASPEFLLVTRWATREALTAYLRSDDFRAVHRNGEEQQAEFALYEVVTT